MIWGNRAHGSRRTDGTLIPKTHQGLQQSLLECLCLREAGQRGAARLASGILAVRGGCFQAEAIRIWGQKTPVDKQRCCWWRLWCSEPPCRDPMGQHHPGLFAGQDWAVPGDVTPKEQSPSTGGKHLLSGPLPVAWSPPKQLSVSVAGPVLTHTQHCLYPLLQIGSEQSLICQHRPPTLRCHQPPLLPCSATCLSENVIIH